LTKVSNPALIAANSLVAHIAKVLILPMAGCVANSWAAIPVAHLLKTIVSEPTCFIIVVASIAPDLSRVVAFLGVRKPILALRSATSRWKLALEWDPRSWAPGSESKSGKKEQKREHLSSAEFKFW